MSIDKKEEVSAWWSGNPMTYGELHGRGLYGGNEVTFDDAEFFKRCDEAMLQWNSQFQDKVPFDRFFPYERFRGKRVLEIGCGMGAMAGQWAAQGADVTAVDLAPFSVEMTRRRFAAKGLTGKIELADGRNLPFGDGEFDYVYSWGVLHHSPDLAHSLREMMRVLRKGGEFGLMLYHRHSLFYLWRIWYREGFVHNERNFLDPVALASRYTDGEEAEGNPHTWPVTRSEVRRMLAPYCADLRFGVSVGGTHQILNAMLPGLSRILPGWVFKPWGERWGWSLLCDGKRA